LLVDDHPLMREGLKAYLEARGIEVVGQAADGEQALALARQTRPDLVVMDLAMPGLGGLEATRLIKSEQPEVSVVILTASEAEADLFEAVKSGAQGYLLKSMEPEQLVAQIEAAGRGEPALTPQLAARILAEFARLGGQPGPAAGPASGSSEALPPRSVAGLSGTPPVGADALTARESDVLELLVAGASNRQIASALVVSENTVKFHLKNILQKLHLQNRAQVVAYALRHRLAEPPALE
jgi:DNA-binding NarL/FixJ family response regulator